MGHESHDNSFGPLGPQPSTILKLFWTMQRPYSLANLEAAHFSPPDCKEETQFVSVGSIKGV